MQEVVASPYKLMAVDDDAGILDSLKIVLKKSGYDVVTFTNPLDAIEELRKQHYDLLLLDFIMDPLHGDEVVAKIREFDSSLYILLLTGHKDLAPPLETLKQLEIQGYCEKGNNFDQLILLIESGLKSVDQMHLISKINEELKDKNEELKKAYLDTIGIPYVGSSIYSSVIAQDKSFMKQILKANDIPVTDFVWFGERFYRNKRI